MITITELERTCEDCPSQWEGRADDGRHVYIRYRFGLLALGVAVEFMDAVRDSRDREPIGIAGAPYDGELTTEEMIGRVERSGVARFALATVGAEGDGPKAP